MSLVQRQDDRTCISGGKQWWHVLTVKVSTISSLTSTNINRRLTEPRQGRRRVRGSWTPNPSCSRMVTMWMSGLMTREELQMKLTGWGCGCDPVSLPLTRIPQSAVREAHLPIHAHTMPVGCGNQREELAPVCAVSVCAACVLVGVHVLNVQVRQL